MASAHEVARYVVRFYQEAGDPVTNLKLQKLLYYVQGWHLALKGERAFGERLEAWVHGPVQPGVYQQYKQYRWNPITHEVADPNFDADFAGLVDEVLQQYGVETGLQLERRSHREPPWLEARGDIAPDQESTAIISEESMARYFKSLAD
jgi:uncharacterized phage-associated protein